MKPPSPHLFVLDEPDGPGLVIAQRCPECDLVVTQHAIDVDDGTDTDIGAVWGEADGYAWLDHVATYHGETVS